MSAGTAPGLVRQMSAAVARAYKQQQPLAALKIQEAAQEEAGWQHRIGFLGAGCIAETLSAAWLKAGIVPASHLCTAHTDSARRKVFQSLGIRAGSCNLEVVEESDIVFVAVKPALVPKVLKEVRKVLRPQQTLVSVAAGVTTQTLLEAAGPDARIVRVMPNTPCLVGETAAAMCLGGKADTSDEQLVRQLFESVGKIYTVGENLLSAVTGLSGSGPAYVFIMIEALADGGVRAGLPRDVSLSLATQTVLGSAKMVLETGKHPGALKDMVTSPGGTTIAGIHALEKAGLRAALMDAVLAATQRAEELSAPTTAQQS